MHYDIKNHTLYIQIDVIMEIEIFLFLLFQLPHERNLHLLLALQLARYHQYQILSVPKLHVYTESVAMHNDGNTPTGHYSATDYRACNCYQ